MEGALGAVLTGLMVLLFLRDWRSALIVVINIPLVAAGRRVALWITGQTINIMTLGGLALAVGILVDEATVAIENIHAHLARGKSLARAALDATTRDRAAALAGDALHPGGVHPRVLHGGRGQGAVRAALAGGRLSRWSRPICLSSTLVPILSVWVLRGARTATISEASFFGTIRQRLRHGVHDVSCACAGCVVLPSISLRVLRDRFARRRRLGTEIFPQVDAGQLAAALARADRHALEGTEQVALKALDLIKREVGADNVDITLGFVGVHAPNYPINLIYLWNGGPEEGVLQCSSSRDARSR